jgi:TetR/AcrR family transcriptional regulator
VSASRQRILEAAAAEFAARGFAGARVDRIARRARVNKAMLYYHFRSKQELYRTLLRTVFTEAATRLQAIAAAAHPAPAKVDAAIEAVGQFVAEHDFFPAIMLREVAEGGAHLDRDTLNALAGVPRAFFAILQEGMRRGDFRPVHPLVAYFSVLAPTVFYLAAGPIRRELSVRHLLPVDPIAPAEFIRQLQEAFHRALSPSPAEAHTS